MEAHELSNGIYVPAELAKPSRKYGLVYEPKEKHIRPSDYRTDRNARTDMVPVWGRDWLNRG